VIALRPYQQEAVAAIIRGFDEYDRQLAVKPTGSGKTVVVAKVSEHFQPGRTLFLAHREELLVQAKDKIFAATDIVAAIEAAGLVASLQAPIVVASVQTLMREPRRARFPANHFKLVVIDEAHHVLAESYQRTLAHFSGTKALGVTATPDRGDKRALGDYFQNIAFEIGLVDLVKAGYLSRIQVRTIPLKIDLHGVRTTGGDYNANDLGNAIEPYLAQIAGTVAADFSHRKTLVFLPLCSLSERFAKLCRERGLPAEHVAGTSKDRAGALERFRSGEIKLLSNSMLYSEGFDEPSIDCVIPLRPTKSRNLFAQQVGRGTRIHPGKDHLLILDFLWQTHKHKLVRPASLVAEDEEEAFGMDGDGDLIENSGRYRQQILDKLSRELDANKKRQGQKFDLLEFAVAIGDLQIAEFQPTMRWHAEPVSQKQFEVLERSGINPNSVRGKGHASIVIERLQNRRKRGLATYKQVRFLARQGVPNAHLVSFTTASALISELISHKISNIFNRPKK
jgi:superfamily II DNA or RNA helicase